MAVFFPIGTINYNTCQPSSMWFTMIEKSSRSAVFVFPRGMTLCTSKRSAHREILRFSRIPPFIYLYIYVYRYIRDGHASFNDMASPWDNISREIARRDLNPRAASFGKTFMPLDQPHAFSPCENWKGNQDPTVAEYFSIPYLFRRRRPMLKRTKTRISREYAHGLYVHIVLPWKDWPALLRSPEILFARKFGDDWHLNTALRVFACCERFCSCEFVLRVRRLLLSLTSPVKVFAPNVAVQISSWRVKCLIKSVGMFCGKLSSSCCTNTSFPFLWQQSLRFEIP